MQYAQAMHAICTSYANYFNAAHGHVGPVFQGRFSSFPIESDDYLTAAVRYIHLNPADITNDIEHYPWSSYPQYLGGKGICNTSFVLSYFDNVDDFRNFHGSGKTRDHLVDMSGYRPRIPDEEALSLAKDRLGDTFTETVPNMTKRDRDHAIARLYALGLSGRQIGRFTGIGKGIIQRAITKARQGEQDQKEGF